MAGHPTIGSTFALAHIGPIAAGREHFVFGLGVGPTRVELQWKDRGAVVRVDGSAPARSPRARRLGRAGARAVGVDHAAFASTGLPMRGDLVRRAVHPACRSAPAPTSTRPSRTCAALAQTEERVRRRSHGDLPLHPRPTSTDDVTAYSRMFAHGLGIAEDPATGSACGPLGCYLVQARTREGATPRRRWSAGKASRWAGPAAFTSRSRRTPPEHHARAGRRSGGLRRGRDADV